MKKAGIVTLFGEYNFGNRLQNYAVQEILKKMGIYPETIKYIGLEDDVPIINSDTDKKRLELFKDFNKNIVFAKDIMYKEYDAPEAFSKDYDYIILGSDQIWNFTFDKIFSDKALASFAPSEKIVSFSASFGVDFVPPQNSELYDLLKYNLNRIKYISVREEKGREIIEKITKRKDIEVLIDPSMLLTVEEWEKVLKKPEKLKTDRFILKSFLGKVSDETWLELNKIAKENRCEIIDISDKNSNFYDVGPSEFLYLEKNAFLVATDSFHSCAFSILYGTPFVVFERQSKEMKSMYSRIDTLLNKFKMQERVFNGKITKEILSSDYVEAYAILAKERVRAKKFLDRVLK